MRFYGQHSQDVANRILDAFKQPDCLPKALAPIFIQRNDDIPCRKWSWHNQLLVALCATNDARGIRQWNKLGRKVKKGSSAIYILAPCIKKIAEDTDNGRETERQILYGFRSVPVFAMEDTEGDPLPEVDDTYDDWVAQLPLLDVAKDWGIQVDTYSHSSGNPLGYYRYSNGGSQAIMLGVENLSTWCHELVHAADHRLTNLKGGKAHREIVAELGGAILLECLGKSHDADLGGAYSYIESYAQQEKKDTVRACIEVLDRVCNCVKLILDTAESAMEDESDTESAKSAASA